MGVLTRRHWYVNGPEPLVGAMKMTVSLEHTVCGGSGCGICAVVTNSVAKFVAEPHGPVASTEYTPPVAAVTLGMFSVKFVKPGMTSPSLRQTSVNGPVPFVTAVNVARLPVQLVRVGGLRLTSAQTFESMNAGRVTE